MTKTAVGIIGLGALGEPIARNVLAAGHPIAVFDVRPEAMRDLARRGAYAATCLAEIAARSDVVLIAVASSEQLETISFGGDGDPGLLEAANPGTLLVVHSTVGAEVCRRLAERAAPHGVEIVDAPVTGPDGAPASAERQDMTYIVGARREALDRVRTILDLSGRRLFHVGDVGDAQDVKLATNALALIQMQATHETLRLLAARGLVGADATAILMASSAANWAVDHWPTISRAANAPGDPASIPRKDLALAIRAAERCGVRLDLAEHIVGRIDEPGHGFLARPPAQRDA